MALPYFNPHQAAAGTCWHCTRFVGLVYGGSSALCSLPNAPRVQADPAHGCSGFVREVGADDEPGPPAVADVQRPFKSAPVPDRFRRPVQPIRQTAFSPLAPPADG